VKEGNCLVFIPKGLEKRDIHAVGLYEHADHDEHVVGILRKAPSGVVGKGKAIPPIGVEQKRQKGMKAGDPILDRKHGNIDHTISTVYTFPHESYSEKDSDCGPFKASRQLDVRVGSSSRRDDAAYP
jgi:hypothetical protein